VKAEYEAYKNFSSANAADLRKLGFGTVSSILRDGILRGTSVLAVLGDGKENELLIKEESAAHYSFDKGSSPQDYPSSLMGSIALIRQSFCDAAWYTAGGKNKETNITLEAINRTSNLPQIFDAGDKLNILRAAAIGKEFNKKFIVKGGGNEYQRLREIKEAGVPLIVSLNFPDAYDLTDPQEAINISYAALKHWELAPANPGMIAKDSIPFALTAADLKKKEDFWKNLRKAISYGLTEEQALKALTVTPASMLGVEKQVGSLGKGMVANFIITSQNLFSKDNIILENWVKGKRYPR
jgi:imidazolonepropionase-like amidohydrolase